jgi:hypothetical protein
VRPRCNSSWLATVGLLIALAGCASPGRVGPISEDPAAPGWRVVSIGVIPLGATIDQVRAELGDPAGIVRGSAGAEQWSFPAGRAAWPEVGGAAVRVRLQDGRVTAIEVARPRS